VVASTRIAKKFPMPTSDAITEHVIRPIIPAAMLDSKISH
jgi:hypothetical protein